MARVFVTSSYCRRSEFEKDGGLSGGGRGFVIVVILGFDPKSFKPRNL